jgi:hypothetical protein
MDKEGPLLERLTHRLGECPDEFLMPPATQAGGVIHVDALVADLLRVAGQRLPAEAAAQRFGPSQVGQNTNWLSLVAVGVWLLADEWFASRPQLCSGMWQFLSEGMVPLSAVAPARAMVADADRREEFARLCLAKLGLRPAGETVEHATDRLNALDSVERKGVVLQTRQAEARARKIREAMAKKAAEAAAAKVSRE